MRSQIYGILGLMYALAIGVLLVVALVGTSKQFAWQSSAPLYRFSMIQLSSNVQRVKTFLSEERVYAADRALFYVGAFGGYSTISDISPKFDAKACGCPTGSELVNINGGSCSSSDQECYCKNTTTGGFVQPNMCLGKDVKMLDEPFWDVIPEKYIVYWYNGTNEIPSKEKIKETAEEYLNFLFPKPDPIIIIPLEILGVKTDFKYITKIDSFSKDYVDIEWIPIGQDSLIFDFPIDNPFIEYGMKLAMETKVKNSLFAVYTKSVNFVKNKKFDSVFNDTSKGILPIVIDENYVTGYHKKDVGTYYCNYSTTDRPDGNPECSLNNINVDNLKPMVALVYYIDEHYWDSNPGSSYNTPKMGNGCGGCKKPNDYLSLSETDLKNSLPCTAEINSTIKDGNVVFRIDKFYGCENGNNLNKNLTCMMCAIVSQMNKNIGGGIESTYTLGHSSWGYENSLSDKNYAIKMVPFEKFNLSLNGFDTKTHVWKDKTFSAWITPPHKYLVTGGCNCNNIVKGGQVGADSICELNGFQKADECKCDNPYIGRTAIWGYNVTKYPKTISCPSGFKKIDYIVCNNASGNTEINLNSKYGISVCGKEVTSSTSGWIKGNLLSQLENNNVDGPILRKLGYACNVMGKELTGIHVKKETNHNVTSPYLYSSSGNINNPIGGDVGAVLKITCFNNNGGNDYTYNLNETPLENSTYSGQHMLGFDYSGLTGNFNNTNKSNKIYNYYGGSGSNIAFVFCQLYCGESCIPDTGIPFLSVTNDSSYNSKYAGYGRLNLNISSNSKFTYTYAIDQINCSGTTWLEGIGFDSVVGINLTDIPLSMTSIYTPNNFANQTIVLKRICLKNNGELLAVHFNDSGDTPGLLIDPGYNSSTIQNINSNYRELSKIKCVIK